MKRTLLKGKIHRAVVTAADLDYEGSLGLDESLMKAADLLPYERVEVYNVTNGERFSTYLVKAAAGSGSVSIFGAAAHKAGVGDKLIITAYAVLEEDELDFFVPKVVLVDGQNRIKAIK
ncbi:MAG: aspartate 1-decarboxylase [Candidatus Aminicenantales bacterium]